MGNLERILGNFGNGMCTGVVKMLDPVGTTLSELDYSLTGVGYSDERALDTVHNYVYKSVYDKPEEKLSFGNDYVPRFFGNTAGAGVTALGLYGLYSSFGWVAAAAIPFFTGIYSAFNSVKQYFSDFKKGEEIDGKYEKASFYDGFKYGWNSGTHLFMDDLHVIETNYSGRSIGKSRLDSSMKESAKNVRRNFSSVAGTFIGGITGGIVSVLTLGLLPLYKSLRDTVKTLRK